MTTVYKIRNKQGLYSTGSGRPHFTKNGKTWKTKGALHNHINVYLESGYHAHRVGCYDNCELVEIEVIEVEKSSIDIQPLLINRKEILENKKIEHKKKIDEWTSKCNLLQRQKPRF